MGDPLEGSAEINLGGKVQVFGRASPSMFRGRSPFGPGQGTLYGHHHLRRAGQVPSQEGLMRRSRNQKKRFTFGR